LSCLPARSQIFQNDGNNPDTALGSSNIRRNRYTVSGDARNAANGAALQRLQVNIRSDDGQTYLATMTDENGRFSFDDLPRGFYTITAAPIGYQLAEERIALQNGPALGVQLRLTSNKAAASANAPETSGTAISAHELTAPHKAREDMVKGLSLLYDKADYPGSIRAFQRAIKEFPGYYEAYAQMGVAYSKLKNDGEAETALRKSLELSDGKYPQACVSLATVLSDGRRFSDAEPVARKAVELDANSWQGYAELTRVLVGLNRLADAEQSEETAVKLRPDEPELYISLINIEGKLPNYPAMLLNMDAYLKLAPNGRAAEQVRALRTQVRDALAKMPPTSPRDAAQPNNQP
jgi:tetratricopeptide (TPR) repeat protein